MRYISPEEEARQLSSASASMSSSLATLEARAKGLSEQLKNATANAKAIERSIAKSADLTQTVGMRTLHNIRKEAAMVMWRFGLALGVYKPTAGVGEPDFSKFTLAHCREYNLTALAAFIVAYNNHITTRVLSLLASKFERDYTSKDLMKFKTSLHLLNVTTERANQIAYQIDGTMSLFDATMELARELKKLCNNDNYLTNKCVMIDDYHLSLALERFIPTYSRAHDNIVTKHLDLTPNALIWGDFTAVANSSHSCYLEDSSYDRSNFFSGIINGLSISGSYPNINTQHPLITQIELTGTSSTEKQSIVSGTYLKIKEWIK